MAEEGYIGLGFHRPGSGSPSHTASAADGASSAADGTAKSPPASVADALMRRYMDQCLEYHQEQREEGSGGVQEEEVSFQPQQQSAFVPAQQPFEATNYANLQHANQTEATKEQQEQHQKAVENARAIAMKFHAQRLQLPAEAGAPASGPPATILIPPQQQQPPPAPSEFAAKRARHAENESRRLRAALLRNFEYVARKDEEGMRAQAEEPERRRAISAGLDARTREATEKRREAARELFWRQPEAEFAAGGSRRHAMTATSKSGIGTAGRKRIEHKKRREGHAVGGNVGRRDMSSAVYITGLPVDGSVTDEELRQLFGCYGAIRRVTMYTNKTTGKLKGDGLVVYEKPRDGDPEELLGAVCSQLNKVELPCGSNLTVEPADANYKIKLAANLGSEASGRGEIERNCDTAEAGAADKSDTSLLQETSASRKETEKAADTEDDLDDFFASLT